jgi:hypothetical protein
MRRLSVLLASAVMALTLIALAVATGASAQQNMFYGASYHSAAKNAAYGELGTTKASAITASRESCEAAANDCTPQVWVYNGVIVVVQGKKTITYAPGPTVDAATASGIKTCEAPPNPDTGCKRTLVVVETAIDPANPDQWDGGPIK